MMKKKNLRLVHRNKRNGKWRIFQIRVLFGKKSQVLLTNDFKSEHSDSKIPWEKLNNIMFIDRILRKKLSANKRFDFNEKLILTKPEWSFLFITWQYHWSRMLKVIPSFYFSTTNQKLKDTKKEDNKKWGLHCHEIFITISSFHVFLNNFLTLLDRTRNTM